MSRSVVRWSLCSSLLVWVALVGATSPAADPVASAACATPTADADWAVAAPDAAGFDTKALCAVFEEAAATDANLHGLLVERNGKLIAELYRTGHDAPITVRYSLGRWFADDVVFGPDVLHDVRSISKSVVSLVFGVVRSEGKLPELSAPVLDSYPELADLRTPERSAITFEHLLTMSSGLAWNEWNAGPITSDETRLFWKSDLVRYVFDRPVEATPGSKFNYNGGSTATLADELSRATGKPLLDLVRADLFEPLGITRWEWALDLHGRPLAFAGLRLRPRDMLKLGRLALDGGRWRGKQIVPEAWVRESLRPHIGTGFAFTPISAEDVGYGYQWWTGTVPWHGRALAWSGGVGNGGQRVFVVPDLDLVVATTAGDYGQMPINGLVGNLFRQIVATVAR
jgi:CubicO group peptidase (beta-lactamase class C family)